MNDPQQEITSTLSSRSVAGSFWHALYTYSRHETSVHNCLRAKNIESFLPTVAMESGLKDGTRALELPAFPGYVFVRIAPSDRSAVLAVPGVVRILSFHGVPAPVNATEIESIRLCVDWKRTLRPHPYRTAGERVRIREGALRGLEGWLVRRKGPSLLVLSIALIHQSVAVELAAESMEPIRPVSNHGGTTLLPPTASSFLPRSRDAAYAAAAEVR